MLNVIRKVGVGLGLLLLALSLSAHPSTYTETELRALHEKEQTAFKAPITQNQQTLLSKIMGMSKRYQAQAQSEQAQGLAMIPHSNATQKPQSNIIVFTSLALPEPMFTQLVTQANAMQVPLLIRGILKGGMRPTIKALSKRLMKGDNKAVLGGVSIDPRAFKQFGITHIPAFVVVRKGHCADSKQVCDANDFDVVSGSISLSNALDLLARKGRFGDEIANIITH